MHIEMDGRMVQGLLREEGVRVGAVTKFNTTTGFRFVFKLVSWRGGLPMALRTFYQRRRGFIIIEEGTRIRPLSTIHLLPNGNRRGSILHTR